MTKFCHCSILQYIIFPFLWTKELIKYILKFEKLREKEQKVLTLALISVERLMRKQKFYHDIYGEYSITFIMKLLFRCIYQKGSEFQLDQR